MAIAYGYATLAELKTFLGINGTVDDTRLETAIEAASRAIDAETSRRFYTLTETAYFSTSDPLRCDLDDDLLSIVTLQIDTTGNRDYQTLDVSDYEIEPGKAPYRQIFISPTSTKSFPINRRRAVKINAAWGYCVTGSHPVAINRACVILAARYFKRKDAVFGVIGTPELGYMRVTAKDPDVKALLAPFRRYELGAV